MVIKISEDHQFRDQFIKEGREIYLAGNATRSKYFHIGDKTYCARKSWIPYIFPSANLVNVYDMGNFMRGLGIEHAVVKVLNHMFKDGEFQMDILFDDITGHPDFVAATNVFEIKSTNSTTPLDLDSYKITSYVRQVVYYMLLTNMTEGKIVINYSLPFFLEKATKKKPKNGIQLYSVKWHQESETIPWYVIKVEISEDEPLRKKIRWILSRKIKPVYDHVIKNRDLTVVPVLDGKIGFPQNPKCRMCNVKKICDMIPDRQTDPELRSYLLNQHIDGVVERQYPEGYTIPDNTENQENNSEDQK